jgi:predicted MFS family arabinose efflux permease
MVIPFLALYLTQAKDFSYGQVGWVMTSFGIGSLIGVWLGGKLTDRIGYYTVMNGSLACTGILFISLQFINGFWPFCAGILVIMIAADSFRPANLVAISAYSIPKNRTRAVTLIRLAINLGFSFGPAVGGWIIVSAGYSGLFWIDGITCLMAAGLMLLLLNPKRVVHQLAEHTTDITTARSAYSDKPYWLFLAMCLFMGFAFMQLFSTIPLYYREEFGLSEHVIGWLMALNGLIIFVLEMPLVHHFENSRWKKIRIVQFSCLLMALSYLLLNVGPMFFLLIGSIILITFGEMLGFPFTNAIAMNRAPSQQSGKYLALYSMSFSVGHIIGPNIGMQLTEHFGFASCWYFMAGIALLAVFLGRRLEHILAPGNSR